MTTDTDTSSYLSELRKALTGMNLSEREEIIDEIRAHIQERSARSGMAVAQVLERLGPAAELARDYNNGALLKRASRSRSPWLLLRTTYCWARTGMLGFGLFVLSFCGYVAGGAFMLCALLKPLFPEQTGLWVGSHGINFGFRSGAAPGATELLGPWFTQVTLLVGVLFFVGTTIAVRALLPKLKRSASFQHQSAGTEQLV